MSETKIGFQAAANSLTEEGSGFLGHIPEAWRQGRTSYGGLTAGLSLTAAQKQLPDLPTFRSATINFIGPVTDDPLFSSRILRAGRNVTSVLTEAHIGSQCVANAAFIFGALRPSDISVTLPAPKAPPPAEC